MVPVIYKFKYQKDKGLYSISDNNGKLYKTIKLGKYINGGAYGEIFGGMMNGKSVAIKIIPKSVLTDAHTNILDEITILNTLSRSCENYLLCYELTAEDDDDYIIVTELIEGEDVSDIIDELADNRNDYKEHISHIICGLINAVLILHKHNIAHRDIKLENIIYNPKTKKTKLLDYGFACFGNHNHDKENMNNDLICSGYKGSPLYVAPEVVSNNKNIDYFKTDIYSIGVVIYLLLCYDTKYSFEELANKVKGNPSYFYQNICSTSTLFDELLKGMLTIDQSERFDIMEVKKRIESYCK